MVSHSKTSKNTVPIKAQQLQKGWKVKIFIETWMAYIFVYL